MPLSISNIKVSLQHCFRLEVFHLHSDAGVLWVIDLFDDPISDIPMRPHLILLLSMRCVCWNAALGFFAKRGAATLKPDISTMVQSIHTTSFQKSCGLFSCSSVMFIFRHTTQSYQIHPPTLIYLKRVSLFLQISIRFDHRRISSY